jgi:hypothetical protein
MHEAICWCRSIQHARYQVGLSSWLSFLTAQGTAVETRAYERADVLSAWHAAHGVLQGDSL